MFQENRDVYKRQQYNKVEICGVNTSKLKVLTEKEKIELLKKVKEGDKKAREEPVSYTHLCILRSLLT